MRHRRNRVKLGRSSAHRKALMMNLAASLIEHERIQTTLPKAKALRPYVEKLVTSARAGDVHSRRIVLRQLRLHDKATSKKQGKQTVVQKLFDDIAPRFADRPGGYTRVVKLGSRPGDSTEMAFIEFVDFVPQAKAHSHAHSHAGHSHDHAHA